MERLDHAEKVLGQQADDLAKLKKQIEYLNKDKAMMQVFVDKAFDDTPE